MAPALVESFSFHFAALIRASKYLLPQAFVACLAIYFHLPLR